MKIKIRNSLFFIFSNLLIFLLLESVFTIFFIYKTSHHGFMSKIFIGDTNKKNDLYEFQLNLHQEQEPDIDNRISLSEKRDPFGTV